MTARAHLSTINAQISAERPQVSSGSNSPVRPQSNSGRFTDVSAKSDHVTVNGKFFTLQGQCFYIKGATYGTFAPDENADQYPPQSQVRADFQLMAQSGINTVRTYTPPPHWLLNLAHEFNLKVMVGIPWEQHMAILDDRQARSAVHDRFRKAAKQCASHPAVFCLSIGNEVPVGIVRWHGADKIRAFLKSLYDVVKEEAPELLVTYVNFPTTEFLQLDFIDFYSFNVYLESKDSLEEYLPRLQTLSANKPLLLAEVGLDSLRNGEQQQAGALSWQLRSIFHFGAAGAFVFAWTDEWFVGGRDIPDWAFGLTTENRTPKPALNAVSTLYQAAPFSPEFNWPSFTVVVCSYNGSRTIKQTLERLVVQDYPNYEVIVVNDGSTDDTGAIAQSFPVTLISTENKGLSSARNTGYLAGSGELVAYIDDDAYPESTWLRYLALAFDQQDVAGVGGPNLPVPGDTLVADCVSNAPGGPMEVMLSDTIAEHIPGCNMSFRRTALDHIGGFDPQFRAAGDDVDLCWRIQQQVGDIGFQPAAFNWHRRRNTVSGYWKQQRGYGKAESMLECKWPDKYNTAGHVSWHGRLYGQGFLRGLGDRTRSRIYSGVWGSAPFQRLYQDREQHGLRTLPLMPEWLLIVAALAVLSLLGTVWSTFQWMMIPLLASIGITLWQAITTALEGRYDVPRGINSAFLKRVALTTCLALMQPAARLIGRISNGLTPFRTSEASRDTADFALLLKRNGQYWDGAELDRIERLQLVESALAEDQVTSINGDSFDGWDLQVDGGIFGSTRLNLLVEHHGDCNELVRYRFTPRWSAITLSTISFFCLFALIALSLLETGALLVCLACATAAACRSLLENARSMRLLKNAIELSRARSQKTEKPMVIPATTTDEGARCVAA